MTSVVEIYIYTTEVSPTVGLIYVLSSGNNNPGITQKPDNPLKVIRNPIPRNLDNTLKGTRDLLKNGTQIQWPRGLTVAT